MILSEFIEQSFMKYFIRDDLGDNGGKKSR